MQHCDEDNEWQSLNSLRCQIYRTDLTKTNIYEPFMSSLILLLQAGKKKSAKKITDDLAADLEYNSN